AIHVADRPAATRLFAEYVPGLERGAEFDYDVTLSKVADARKAKLEMRRKPVELERIPRVAQIAEDVLEVRLAEMRQHPAVMEVGAPAHEAVPVWLAPELADESAQQEMLGETHARMGRHLEGAHLDEPKTAIAALRREQLI